jgi:long-chain acyl-CoA synthetase
MEKIWLKSYPAGIPAEINADEFASLADLFDKSCAKYSEKDAFVCMGTALTYAALEKEVAAFASYLQNHTQLQIGDRIGMQMPNCLAYPVAIFGALRAGLVVVNINPLYTPREMQHQYADSGCKAVVILENFAANLAQILPKTAIQTVIITRLGDLQPAIKGFLVNTVVKYVRKMVPSYSLPNAISFPACLRLGGKLDFRPVAIDREDLAFIQYTGGTTGVSKGAMLTHRNLLANMAQMSAWLGSDSPSNRQEIIITALPLYHIFALTVNCLAFLKFGGKNILVTNPRDMKAFCRDLKKYPFTVFSGVNTLFNGLMNSRHAEGIDWSTLRFCVAGGMALQRAVGERWLKFTGTAIFEGYGMTEASPVTHCNPIHVEARPGSIGMPVPSTEVMIIDDNGNETEGGKRGELCIRGPQVMRGYYERPEETEKTMMPGGWLKTGDIAEMDPDGFFRIVDRKKEMILVSGFNVFPSEVEEVVAMHPGVLESAVVGVPDVHSGEAVKVFIVKKDESLTIEAIREFCRENLTGYKVPKYVEFRSELPKSNVGKILRRPLREESILQMATPAAVAH